MTDYEYINAMCILYNNRNRYGCDLLTYVMGLTQQYIEEKEIEKCGNCKFFNRKEEGKLGGYCNPANHSRYHSANDRACSTYFEMEEKEE